MEALMRFFASVIVLFCCVTFRGVGRCAYASNNLSAAITLTKQFPQLTITLRNDGKQALRVWNDWNSWGWKNTAICLVQKDGNVTCIRRAGKVFMRNIPSYTELGAGQCVTRSFNLSDGTWEVPKDYKLGDVTYVSAVYTVRATDEAKELRVWTGVVVSPWSSISPIGGDVSLRRANDRAEMPFTLVERISGAHMEANGAGDVTSVSFSSGDRLTEDMVKYQLLIPPPRNRPQPDVLGLSRVAILPRLTVLDLGDTRVGDDELASIEGMTNLRTLNLANTEITDNCAQHIRHLARLERLSLCNTRITDRGLKQLAGMSSLRGIYLGGTDVTSDGIGCLADIPGLRSLTLWHTQIDDRALLKLKPLVKLERLDLTDTKITAKGIASLNTFAALRELLLPYHCIDVQAARSLAELPRLASLDLSGCRMAEGALSQFVKMKEIKNINLTATRISDSDLASIETLAQLRRIDLSYTDVTSDGLRAIREWSSLESLSLRASRVDDRVVGVLSALSGLRSLDLSRTNVTNAGLMKLLRLKGLQYLNVSETKITSRQADSLRRLFPTPKIVQFGETSKKDTGGDEGPE
jgi:Leucine-rich repeat (LRR) protein